MKCNVDIRQLKQFQQRIEKMAKKQEVDALCERIANDIASRLLRRVIQKTPVGEDRYINLLVWRKGKDGSAKVVKNKDGTPKLKETKVYSGSTLKGNWRAGPAVKKLNMISIEIANDIYYASYVEYGHRQTPGRYVPAIGKRLKSNWANGKFMLTTSVQEVKRANNNIAIKHLKAYLRRIFND